MKKPSLFHYSTIICTFFWSGKAPKAPGTFGSLATLPFWVLVNLFVIPFSQASGYFMSTFILSWLIIINALFVLGIWASNIYMKNGGKHDPGEIVIDEVVGQSITLLMAMLAITFYPLPSFAKEDLWAMLFISFVLFRIFDIIKPFPIHWLDKNVKGGFGVMLDDVFAGIFAGILFVPCWWLYSELLLK